MIQRGEITVPLVVANRERQYLLLADEDLMSLISSKNTGAFAALYDRHSRVAYSLACRMMGERQAAEDLIQEAFLSVWRAAGSYRAERGSVRTWILSIVHNRGIDQLRSSANRRKTQARAEAEALTSQPSEAFVETWRNSQRERVKEALRGLQYLQPSYNHSQTKSGVALLIASLL